MSKRESTLPIGQTLSEAGDLLSTLLLRIGQSNRPDRPMARLFDLQGLAQVHLGRGDADAASLEGETLRLSQRDRWMSEEHAAITCFKAGGKPLCVLEDLGSTNGCRVNGVPVQRHELLHGDLIETGQTFWKFHQRAEPATARLQDSAYCGGQVGPTSSVSPTMLHNLQQLDHVADTEIPVIVLGDSGTGKEVFSAALHRRSKRPGKFVVINCAAIPAALVESELFGHRKGAFTGACAHKRGVVEEADGGTLLLDEVGDMPVQGQAALLRLIQERSFMRVGETHVRSVDVRFVAATNRDLPQMVNDGTFRGDLFARLNGICLRLPPLRRRKEDLGLLLSVFLDKCGSQHELSLEAYRALLSHDWPFNIRELEKTITTAAALAQESPKIRLSDLPDGLQHGPGEAPDGPPPSRPADARPSRGTLKRYPEEGLRDGLVELLTRHAGNIAAVAREMDTSRAQVHRLLKRAELDPVAFRRR